MHYIPEDYKKEIRERMRGGDGQVEVTKMAAGVPNLRLFGVLKLEKGCSIGTHEHTGEAELFYVLRGKGVFTDCGQSSVISVGETTVTASGGSHSLANPFDETLEVLAVIVTE
ncbi:MAG: cupin domain-containing protein [Eubacteriales bacterium]|nr:cupin domain-containing protein [Eubacteriales bacterium]